MKKYVCVCYVFFCFFFLCDWLSLITDYKDIIGFALQVSARKYLGY